jgi:FMN phosphatase YigB (HAD superfamily)
MHVAFDIGNVLVEMKLDIFTSELKKYIPADEDPNFLLEDLQAAQDIGLNTVRRYLQTHYGIKDASVLNILMNAWNASLIPNHMMLNFMDNLKSEGVKIALLSNMGMEHAAYLRQSCPVMFDGHVEHLSYEVGARKPTKLYFQSFLMDHDEFTGAVYLDDRDENLMIGKKYSFKSFKFDLDYILKQPLSKQKIELEKVKSYIFDRKYDKIAEKA